MEVNFKCIFLNVTANTKDSIHVLRGRIDYFLDMVLFQRSRFLETGLCDLPCLRPHQP